LDDEEEEEMTAKEPEMQLQSQLPEPSGADKEKKEDKDRKEDAILIPKIQVSNLYFEMSDSDDEKGKVSETKEAELSL
jgi:hypothetical protein